MNKQKVAIVTGGTRGIGESIVRKLVDDGFAVAVNYSKNSLVADELVRELNCNGAKTCAIKCDVSSSKEVKDMFDSIENTLGKVDVLINNAGVMQLATVANSSDELFDTQVAINFKGTFNTLREASNRLNNKGRIVNLSTSVVGLKLETYSVYSATKAAIESLTCILSKELRGRSITVNAVAPGPTATDLFLNGKSPELVEKMSKMNPLERLGTPEDVANVVAFLVSPSGEWINGQVLRTNGGMI